MKVIEIVRTEDCPCGGKRAWKWHKQRDMPPCERARAVKYGNYKRWQRNVEKNKRHVSKVLRQDPAREPWIAGTAIYVDEEERP